MAAISQHDHRMMLDAYRRVEKRALLQRALRQPATPPHDARVSAIRLDARDRPVQFGPDAWEWLKHFFGSPHRTVVRLPQAVRNGYRTDGPQGCARARA